MSFTSRIPTLSVTLSSFAVTGWEPMYATPKFAQLRTWRAKLPEFGVQVFEHSPRLRSAANRALKTDLRKRASPLATAA
jgi:hypothetical protein